MNINIYFYYISLISSQNEKCFRQMLLEKTKSLYVQNFFFDNHALYEKICKNIVERGRPEMTIWRMCIACWIPKSTNTHSQYVMLIAFPQQQWMHERASMLRYTYIDCIVLCCSEKYFSRNLLNFFVHIESSHNFYVPLWQELSQYRFYVTLIRKTHNSR
jgi:hypothetical protein